VLLLSAACLERRPASWRRCCYSLEERERALSTNCLVIDPFLTENISQIQKDAYHPDVNVHEVRRNKNDREEGGDELVAIFLHDNYARSHKSSGAWMSDYRSPKKNLVT
jgi:hypothetical protein